MDKPKRGEAKDFVEVLRDVVKQELSDLDTTAVCEVESVNEDKTLNLYILPDKQRTVRNIINQCRYEFKSGDTALIYLINNRLSNSFVIAKYDPKKSDFISSGFNSKQIKELVSRAITQALAGEDEGQIRDLITGIIAQELEEGGDINSSIKEIFNEEFNKKYKVGDLYLSTNPTDPAELFGGTWEELPAGKVLEIVPYEEVSVTAGTYQPNVYYIKSGDNYVISDSSFDSNAIYYQRGVSQENIAAGLPNVKGSVYGLRSRGGNNSNPTSFSGALYGPASNSVSGGYNTGVYNDGTWTMHLDAATGEVHKNTPNTTTYRNDVYGKSETVQPPAYSIYGWLKIAD